MNRVLKITFLQKEKIQEDATIFLHIDFKSIYPNVSYNKTTKKNKKKANVRFHRSIVGQVTK